MNAFSFNPILRPIDALRPHETNARTHSQKQIKQIANSIERFDFTIPALVSPEGRIIAGHGRVEAARLLGWNEVPTLEISHLPPAELRAYVLADNELKTIRRTIMADWTPALPASGQAPL
jgi:ParB-like chromosome segregation protein Spo0J